MRYISLSLLAMATWTLHPGTPVLAEDKVPRASTQDDGPIDFERARQLLQRLRKGDRLTPEEKDYLNLARELRRQRRAGANAARPQPTSEESTRSLTPLTDLAANDKYKGEDGGLYGGGKNVPPPGHLKAAMEQANQIQPLDASGKAGLNGKIVLLSSR